MREDLENGVAGHHLECFDADVEPELGDPLPVMEGDFGGTAGGISSGLLRFEVEA